MQFLCHGLEVPLTRAVEDSAGLFCICSVLEEAHNSFSYANGKPAISVLFEHLQRALELLC